MSYEGKVANALLEKIFSSRNKGAVKTVKKKPTAMIKRKVLVEKLLSNDGFVQALDDLEKAAKHVLEDVAASKKPLQKVADNPQKVGVEEMKKTTIKSPEPKRDVAQKKNEVGYVEGDRPLNITFRVPNLRVGVPFEENLVATIPIDGVPKLSLVNTGMDLALSSIVKLDHLKIKGVIHSHGEHTFKMEGIMDLPSGKQQRCHAELKIIVNPDPKSLWKNIPSDQAAKYHKPDEETNSQETATAVLIGASVRGRSHAHKGIHRDDDFFIDSTSEWNIVAVADGAGAHHFSRKGAELAVQKSTAYLKEKLGGALGLSVENAVTQEEQTAALEQTLVPAVHEAVKAIAAEVDLSNGETVKDFSTTLMLVAHKKCSDGHLIISFWVGDGAVALYGNQDMVRLLGTPDSGEFAGQTRFLDEKMILDNTILSRCSFAAKVPKLTAIILATDGITDAKFETERQLENLDKWDALWAEIGPLVEGQVTKKAEQDLLKWMEFWSPGNHDDRTISLCLVK